LTYDSRTAEGLIKALNAGHVTQVVPNWETTAKSATGDATEFFDLTHEVWSTCSAHIKTNTITSVMYAMVWYELTTAYSDAMAANYFASVRALRFVFESSVLAALLESKYAGDPDDNAKVLRALEDEDFKRFRFRMLLDFEKAGIINSSERTDLETLYGDLSVKGTHANPAFLSNLKVKWLVLHQFDARMFKESKEMCRGVVDLLLVVLTKKYESLAYDPLLQNWARDLNLAMSRSRMRTVP
jgi:hypothetical protein